MNEITSSNTPDKGSPGGKAADQKFCFSCGAVLHFSALHCPQCGANQPGNQRTATPVPPSFIEQNTSSELPANHVYCRGCGQAIHESAPTCPKCGAAQRAASAFPTISLGNGGRERMVAALLAFLLGGVGAHKFYLGQGGLGVIYLLFCWTFIPALIAMVEGIIYLTMSDAEFAQKYP